MAGISGTGQRGINEKGPETEPFFIREICSFLFHGQQEVVNALDPNKGLLATTGARDEVALPIATARRLQHDSRVLLA